jgi:integrase
MPRPPRGCWTLTRLAAAYLAHAQVYYRQRHTGQPTREHLNIGSTLRSLLDTLPDMPVDQVERRHLVSWREQLIRAGRARSYINASLARVKRMARWAIASEICTAQQVAAILAVEPLAPYRSAAREPARRQPANLEHAMRILDHVPPAVADIVELLARTGARLSEIASARPADVMIDQHGTGWLCPPQHKCAHRGQQRAIPLSPEALAIVQRRLAMGSSWLFPSPRAAGALGPTGVRGPIRRACRRLGFPPFSPHQLRHAVARLVRAQHGLDATAALLGHRDPRTTALYAPPTDDAAARAARGLDGVITRRAS